LTTIHDVARRAGVSIATVSRVINNVQPIDPETAQRVRAAIEELDYHPNYVARGLRRRSTRSLGLIVSDNSNPFFAEVARAVEDAGYEAGYSVILCNSDLSTEKQERYIDVLISRRVDGIVLMSAPGSDVKALVERISHADIPLVIANNEVPDLGVDEVQVTFYEGGYTAGRYLLDLGHRSIAYIGFFSEQVRGHTARAQGFMSALSEAGIELASSRIAYGRGRYQDGRAAAAELLGRGVQMTAVFVFDDLMAMGVIKELQARGLSVPGDVSVVGFDNIVYSEATTPAITTVAQPIARIGHECVRLLLERIEQPEVEPRQVLLPTELVERESCRRLD